MALEAVVSSQGLFGYTMRELCSVGGGVWGYEFGGLVDGEDNKGGVVVDCEQGLVGNGSHANWTSSLLHNLQEWDVKPPPPPPEAGSESAEGAGGGRRKRRRVKKCKNKEEVENQRMTHIAVERNRRKQMNEYLAVLRSLMPSSYTQRSDQASIIGGAINFVKELEHLLQSLEAQKLAMQASDGSSSSAPFADFFSFPQYSCNCANRSSGGGGGAAGENPNEMLHQNRSSVADIEVTVVESHASLKVRTRRQPQQLLKLVVGLQSCRMTTLHLNVTTAADQMVLYSLSLKIEEGCQLTSVDEIAAAVHRMVEETQQDAGLI